MSNKTNDTIYEEVYNKHLQEQLKKFKDVAQAELEAMLLASKEVEERRYKLKNKIICDDCNGNHFVRKNYLNLITAERTEVVEPCNCIEKELEEKEI